MRLRVTPLRGFHAHYFTTIYETLYHRSSAVVLIGILGIMSVILVVYNSGLEVGGAELELGGSATQRRLNEVNLSRVNDVYNNMKKNVT